MKKLIATGVVALAVGMAVPLPQFLAPAKDAVSSSVRCEEDMPCWDCNKDGNGECGDGSDNAKIAGRASSYAEAYELCSEWEHDAKSINNCRWAAWYAFGGTRPVERKDA